MQINRSIMVHVSGTYDEFTALVREYEKIYGHAAKEVTPVSHWTQRQFVIESDSSLYPADEITLFHSGGVNEQS